MRNLAVRPFDDAALDAPPGSVRERTLTYIVCATPRSGSTLLCRALGRTGVAGTPIEYLGPRRRAMFAARWGCGTDLPAYMKALTERRTGSNGVFGMKVLWPQLEVAYGQILGRRWAAEVPFALKAEALERLLGARPVYVHILRRDLDRQAVSLWTAERTGVWSRAKAADSPQAARYSFRGIRDCRRRLALAEAHWDRFFRVNDIEPIEVAYEDISASFESTVAAVLDRLVPGAAVEIPPPLTVRQADARSEEMYERFLGDLGRHHPDRLSERVGRRLRPR